MLQRGATGPQLVALMCEACAVELLQAIYENLLPSLQEGQKAQSQSHACRHIPHLDHTRFSAKAFADVHVAHDRWTANLHVSAGKFANKDPVLARVAFYDAVATAVTICPACSVAGSCLDSRLKQTPPAHTDHPAHAR